MTVATPDVRNFRISGRADALGLCLPHNIFSLYSLMMVNSHFGLFKLHTLFTFSVIKKKTTRSNETFSYVLPSKQINSLTWNCCE
jgi:hypothetical protein